MNALDHEGADMFITKSAVVELVQIRRDCRYRRSAVADPEAGENHRPARVLGAVVWSGHSSGVRRAAMPQLGELPASELGISGDLQTETISRPGSAFLFGIRRGGRLSHNDLDQWRERLHSRIHGASAYAKASERS